MKVADVRKPKLSEWVRYRDAKRLAQSALVVELREIAIEFASRPEEECWTGHQISAFLRKRIALRRKYGPLSSVPVDDLPPNAVKLQVSQVTGE